MRLSRRLFLTVTAAGAVLPAFAGGKRRVAIAGGALTEIAFALGAGERVVGVDSTSRWPPRAQELPQMGYLRRLSPEGVLGLSPDLLIAAPDAGPPSALSALEAAGVEILLAPETDGLDAVPEKMRFMGRALRREAQAAAMASEYEVALARARAEAAALPGRPRTLFLLSAARGAPMAAGAGTSAAEAIEASGAVNALHGFRDWKPVSPEALIAAAPDVVAMMDGHAERAGGAEAVLSLAGLSETPAAQAGRLVTVDGVRLLDFGPRTPAALVEFARALRAQPSAGARP